MPAQILVLVATALAGGTIPLVVRRSDRLLHLFVAFATGIFLGTVFLHLLPELAQQRGAPSDGADGNGPGHDALVWTWVLVGVLGPFLLEKLVIEGRPQTDPHLALGWGSFFGLSIHALTTGVGLAAAGSAPRAGGVALRLGGESPPRGGLLAGDGLPPGRTHAPEDRRDRADLQPDHPDRAPSPGARSCAG